MKPDITVLGVLMTSGHPCSGSRGEHALGFPLLLSLGVAVALGSSGLGLLG